MDDLTLLSETEHELGRVIAGLRDDELELATNCPPWTVRRLASHALKNQLFWAGCVTGQELMPQDEAMAAVPYDGGLDPIAAEVTTQVVALWNRPGVLGSMHRTPFGDLPGTVVINFALVDAAVHAWDLSSSVGRAIDFPAEWLPGMTAVVGMTCNADTVALGLVKPPVDPATDATDTERLMALTGRPRWSRPGRHTDRATREPGGV